MSIKDVGSTLNSMLFGVFVRIVFLLGSIGIWAVFFAQLDRMWGSGTYNEAISAAISCTLIAVLALPVFLHNAIEDELAAKRRFNAKAYEYRRSIFFDTNVAAARIGHLWRMCLTGGVSLHLLGLGFFAASYTQVASLFLITFIVVWVYYSLITALLYDGIVGEILRFPTLFINVLRVILLEKQIRALLRLLVDKLTKKKKKKKPPRNSRNDKLPPPY